MSQLPRTFKARRAFWFEHVRRLERSGRSVAAYAAAHGLSVKSLSRWRSRARLEGAQEGQSSSTGAEAGFVRVALAPARAPVVVRIGLPNGCTVEVTGPLDSALLATVLRESAAL
jgi:hypothetical protein